MILGEGKTGKRLVFFFFLILFAAVLWAVFLLYQGEFLQFAFIVAALAVINPLIAFIDAGSPAKKRMLFFFYVIVLVALLWAAFLLALGVHLWVSLLLFILVIGIPALLHFIGDEPEPVSSGNTPEKM